MAPASTFERVYRELKRQLKSGCFAPGERLEPAALSGDLNASVTPIRDALHRLAGERLVETPQHNGFRAPLLTEIAVRDLYRWNADLLLLALRSAGRDGMPGTASAPHEEPQLEEDGLASSTARLFMAIAQGSGNCEHTGAIGNARDRLHPLRRIESDVLDDAAEELDHLSRLFRAGNAALLRRAIAAYHRRRHRAAPQLLERLHRSHIEAPGNRRQR